MKSSEKRYQITVRDAEAEDLSALTSIKGEGSQAVHRDRLRDVQTANLRYLVVLADREIVGFACLVFHRPSYWSDADDTEHLPQIIDLLVKESQRRKGYGSALIQAMERIAVETGYRQLYISVEPVDNPLAHALYLRLGFQPLQSGPYLKAWEFRDSAGKVHQGKDRVVDMVKGLWKLPAAHASHRIGEG